MGPCSFDISLFPLFTDQIKQTIPPPIICISNAQGKKTWKQQQTTLNSTNLQWHYSPFTYTHNSILCLFSRVLSVPGALWSHHLFGRLSVCSSISWAQFGAENGPATVRSMTPCSGRGNWEQEAAYPGTVAQLLIAVSSQLRRSNNLYSLGAVRAWSQKSIRLLMYKCEWQFLLAERKVAIDCFSSPHLSISLHPSRGNVGFESPMLPGQPSVYCCCF